MYTFLRRGGPFGESETAAENSDRIIYFLSRFRSFYHYFSTLHNVICTFYHVFRIVIKLLSILCQMGVKIIRFSNSIYRSLSLPHLLVY